MEGAWEIGGVSTMQNCLHRLYRRGICPILEMTVTYPVLTCLCGTPSPEVMRFNKTYHALAEGWMSWGEGVLSEQVKKVFAEGGTGASYRFERWRATCDVAVILPTDGVGVLTVTRTVRLCGEGISPVVTAAEDIWRRADLTLSAVSVRRRDSSHP